MIEMVRVAVNIRPKFTTICLVQRSGQQRAPEDLLDAKEEAYVPASRSLS